MISGIIGGAFAGLFLTIALSGVNPPPWHLVLGTLSGVFLIVGIAFTVDAVVSERAPVKEPDQ